MVETGVRHAAAVLLESAIRIAPLGTREWGRAMRGELDYVEGSWATGMWALGGTTVLVKQALISLVVPGRYGQGMVPDGGLFAKSATLRRAALAIGAAFIIAALLFFAAPPFRQAFEVAMRPWCLVLNARDADSQAGLQTLAKRAEAQRDAEGMAFCAVRLQDPRQGRRLAEDAVRLDPNLIWVYAVVAMRDPGLPQAGEWLKQLTGWDRNNSLFYLIAAENIERSHFRHLEWMPATAELQQVWRHAMSAAFHSSKFDDYLDRVAQLNRRVIPRYGFYDPYAVVSREQVELPAWAFENAERFARSLLKSGAELEARGDRKGARDECWTVARFGQTIDSQGRTAFEHGMGTALQSMAYRQLQALAEKDAQVSEAQLFAYLAAKFDGVKGQYAGFPGESAFGMETAERNAAVVQISGLMMLLFSGLIIIAGFIFASGHRRAARAAGQSSQPVATIVLLSSALGLLFSSVTLYLTYRPYWYIFRSAVQNGERVPTNDLRYFLTQGFAGVSPHRPIVLMNALLYSGSPGFLFYFWAGATLLGVIGLVLILLRHFRSRPPTIKASPP